jgi:hypothetical protein
LYVKSLDWIFQHWLLYDKLSSNNNNNYHHVSVIQVCVSELTTCRALVLYNTYVVAFVLADWCQFCSWGWSTAACFVCSLFSDNGHSHSAQWQCFVCTDLYHTAADENSSLLYINAILIQSQNVDFWQLYWLSEMQYDTFLKCHCTSKHFSECCSNCKWHDHAAHCSVHNNDVLIVILNDENNNAMRMSALLDQDRLHPHCQRQLLLTSTFKYIWLLFFSCVVFSIGLVVQTVYDIWAVCLISVWCSEQVASAKSRRHH